MIITGGEAKTRIIQNVDCVYLQPMDITGNDNIPCKAFGYAVGESKQTSGCPNKFVKFCNIQEFKTFIKNLTKDSYSSNFPKYVISVYRALLLSRCRNISDSRTDCHPCITTMRNELS